MPGHFEQRRDPARSGCFPDPVKIVAIGPLEYAQRPKRVQATAPLRAVTHAGGPWGGKRLGKLAPMGTGISPC